ncbi:MarR family transcriptional regulator [Rhodococcus sp. IEGM 1379]|uniref:MarR family winged helix-turn-helix transcriptional regulator n=1 Tax=Rhodococcus sp. IEGM 1379 TaxID=3047086 RepID=UPI0024B68B30|nr:MarR family transcriptional regulator [Rhodococcus sp. IEGM 1379]MDI9915608.1 MarR family transcriptional regulator [Rhodococcus sp. IEGM 1379]
MRKAELPDTPSVVKSVAPSPAGAGDSAIESVHLPENWPTARLLSTAARAVERRWADALTELGLTHAGLIVLHLIELGVSTQAELARNAHVEAQTMSRTVDRLERAGHITRSPDTVDRRRHVVHVTPEGHALWQRARGLEAAVFPAVADPEALRTALLQIIKR